MTNYSTDDAERWAEVFLDPAKGRVIFTPPSEAEDVAAQAGADGIEVAMQTAESYDGRFWPSGERHWQLNTLPVVRQQLDIVMSAHRHPAGATAVSEWMPPMPGVALPCWDDGDPACMRTHFLVFACSPTTAHSMRFDSVGALLERRRVHRRSCDWRGINLMCADYAPDHLMLSRGQFVVAFATCFACREWLVAGAPDQVEWLARHHDRADKNPRRK